METDNSRLPTRFWIKTEDTTSGCWLWTGALHRTGYGHFKWEGRVREAHAVAYEVLVGPVPEGLQLDHTCHDANLCGGGWSCIHRRCVNPAHLEPVTPLVNIMRGKNANHSLCRAGLHPWDGTVETCPECARVRKNSWGDQRVTCPACGREGTQRHKSRHAKTCSRLV